MVGIGPVVVQAFPGELTGALRDVGVIGALAMHFEVLVGMAGERLRAAWSEVGEPGDELFEASRWSSGGGGSWTWRAP